METYADIFSGFRLLSTTKQSLTQSSREPESKATAKRHRYPVALRDIKMAARESVGADL